MAEKENRFEEEEEEEGYEYRQRREDLSEEGTDKEGTGEDGLRGKEMEKDLQERKKLKAKKWGK
jgi:hypothetical protein